MVLIKLDQRKSGWLGMQSELGKNFIWQGREDSEDGDKGLRWHQVVNGGEKHQNCSLVGFACDLGVAANKGRTGAKAGPDVLRAALANYAWHSNTGLHDQGTIVANHDLVEAQSDYASNVSSALNQNHFVIGLGGGHEIAWGSYQGLWQTINKKPNKRIGIVNFDAHFDLRRPAPNTSSGTPFRQIAEHCQEHNQDFHYACLGVAKTANTPALFDYAERTQTRYLLDEHCTVDNAKECLLPMLRHVDYLYITVCLDAFPGHLAPGVSAPSSLGISPQFVIDCIRWLAASQNDYGYQWLLADIAEMNPQFDIDNRTAKLAARVIFEMAQAKFPG